MKKTIAAMALMASATSANALVPPGEFLPEPPEPKKYCLSLYVDQNGNTEVSDCDMTEANKVYELELKENGCAEGQALMTVYDTDVKIPACPTAVQL